MKPIRSITLTVLLLQSLFFNLCFAVSPDSSFLSSPYESVYTFLEYQQKGDFHLDTAAKPFLRSEVTLAEAKDYAVKLKQVLDARGVFINMQDVPNEVNYLDSATRKHRYYLSDQLPSVYLEKTAEGWLFSRTTLENIPELHHDSFPFGTARLLNLLPRLGTREYFGLSAWQLVTLLILILLSFIIHKILTYLIDQIFYRAMVKAGYKQIAKNLLLPVARPASLLIIFLLLSILIPVVQLPPKVNHYVIMALRATLPIFTTVVFYKLVDILGFYLMQLAEKTESTLDDQLVPLVRKTLKTFVVVVGVIFTLQNLNFNVTALVAGISIGGLAFALAAQDTIKNFFGSLMIFIDRPFQIGHWITSGEIDGTVEEVGFRSTRVRTFRNSVTYVPNGKMADAVIDNHGLRSYRRFYTKIAITYDTPPYIADQFVEGLKQIVKEHPKTRKDFFEIHLNDFGSYAIEVMFYIFFEVPTWSEELACRHQIMSSVIKLANTLGVRFALPTQTLHMENFPGKPSLSPNFDSEEASRQKLRDFFSGKKSE